MSHPSGALDRNKSLERLRDTSQTWDFVVIGGGATGAGIALDAASRGYSVALLEAYDFGKGTSSRATKLVHGGVRYLQQGNIALVMDALRERGRLHQNAPHLVSRLEHLIPTYALWQIGFYLVGLKLYDALSGRLSFGPSRYYSARDALDRIPTLKAKGLRGGIGYFDGQFDDSRLAMNIVQTATENGGCVINYAPVNGFVKDSGKVVGVTFTDKETGEAYTVRGRCIVNATGPFCDELRQKDEPQTRPLLAHSQGVHIVLPRRFLPGDTALMVPRTSDGRVLFALPWQNHVVVGTTDTPIQTATPEPTALAEEVHFILQTAGAYLTEPPTQADILSVFTGIRPLVRKDGAKSTAALARDHTIVWSDSGLVTITGGKWTTYRKMAEDLVNQAVARVGLLPAPCRTQTLPLHGATAPTGDALSPYGTDTPHIQALIVANPNLAERLHPDLPFLAAQVVWAARCEMARTVEDVLARRTRALFVDANAALNAAPIVAKLLAEEFGKGRQWEAEQITAFHQVAQFFLLPSSASSREPQPA